MTIQIKTTEHYFHVALFIMLNKMVVTFKPVNETQVCDHSNESYWAVLSYGTVYYAVQGGSNFKSVNETLVCDHSNKSYRAVPSRGTVNYAIHRDTNVQITAYL